MTLGGGIRALREQRLAHSRRSGGHKEGTPGRGPPLRPPSHPVLAPPLLRTGACEESRGLAGRLWLGLSLCEAWADRGTPKSRAPLRAIRAGLTVRSGVSPGAGRPLLPPAEGEHFKVYLWP